jgi:hypothetical protein
MMMQHLYGCRLRKRLTAIVDENLASTHGGAVTRPSFSRGVAAAKIVNAIETGTVPRGDPHQLRHWIRTLTRPRPGRIRVGLAVVARPLRSGDVKVGRICRPIITETRRGAGGSAHAFSLRFVSVSAPSRD